jgi:hypothetical protein
MRTGHLLAIATFVAIIFNVVYVTPGSATEILWLKNGNPIVASQFAETEGEITIGNLKTVLGEDAVLCSLFFDMSGGIGPGAKGEISGVLTSAGIETELGETELTCVNVKNCPSPHVVGFNLPWVTKLELMGTETEPLFLEIYTGKTGSPGWEIDCLQPLLGLEEESCTGEFSSNVENDPGEEDVLESFSVSEQETEGLLLTCSGNREKTGFITTNEDGPVLTKLVDMGQALAVSYE